METKPLLNNGDEDGDQVNGEIKYHNDNDNGDNINDISFENQDDGSKESEDFIRRERKRLAIEYYVNSHTRSDPGYVDMLKSFALSEGGFIDDKIRAKVWPEMLNLEPEKYEVSPNEEEIKAHPEYTQVVLDVDRSIKRFPPGIPYEQRVAMQDQLIHLILRIVTKYPQLQYYQGYHDVAITFLLVAGENVAFHIMEKLSIKHLKHFMEATMEKTADLLNYIFPLLDRIHPELCDYIESADVGTMFCLPWFLTWYSHTLTRYEHVVRFYDYFLASPPLLPLYLAVEIIVHRQDEIFNTDCDMASLHHVLSQLPEDLPYEKLLHQATELYEKYPPAEIEHESIERVKIRNKKRADLLEQQQKHFEKERLRNKKRVEQRSPYWIISHIIPHWFLPYGRLFLLGATLAAGYYIYLRYSNNGDVLGTTGQI